VQCPKCGMEVTGGAEACRGCGEVMANPSSAPQYTTSRQFGSAASLQPAAYAGFWLRLIAYLIDSVLVGIVVLFVILLPMMQRAGIPLDNARVLFTDGSRQIVAINLAASMTNWLYWSLMESSSWQATLGKRMLGLRVTDLAGRRISFARATGRYFGKIIFFGFIFAGFTEKKQALHDMIAGCLVLKKM
jgi:uncharacterized RDD family membrane protein YckC